MAQHSLKRQRGVVDLTADELRSKTARAGHREARTHGYLAPPPSSSVSSAIPWSQVVDDDDDEGVDLTQDDPILSVELYGTLDCKIVGTRYYTGVATPQELVALRRESTNPYDSNAIRVNNVMGEQIGHVPRQLAAKLAPYVDSSRLVLEGRLTGEKGPWDCPVRIYLYGTGHPASRLELERKLQVDGLLKAEQLHATRKEADARRSVAQSHYRGGSSSQAGPRAATRRHPEVWLSQIVAKSTALHVARADELADVLAMGEETLQAMPLASQPEGLKSQLLPYQLQGLAWMMAKENPQLPPPDSKQPVQLWRRGQSGFRNLASGFTTTTPPTLFSGGILGDDMGLGKTLQVISLMLAEKKSGPTLIVAPVSVMGNWEQQLAFHVKESHQPRVHLYYVSKGMPASELEKLDIVITSYGMISTEFRAPKDRQRLLAVEWGRVVLDEGHTIRNAKTNTAKAMHALHAQSRWVITGTPIINQCRDLHSLLKFLGLSGGLEDDAVFSQLIARPIKQHHHSQPHYQRAAKLLGNLMQEICLRRKKDMKFINLKLPPKTEFVHRIQLDKSEREKYDAMRAEAQGELQAYQARGNKGLGYTHVLEILLRLRQICNHWALCKGRVNEVLGLLDGQKVVALTSQNVSILQQALQLMMDSQEDCPICFEGIGLHEPVITACKHVFGTACISKAVELQGKCPICRAELTLESIVGPAEPVGDHVDPAEQAVDDTCRSSKTEALVKIVEATLNKAGSKIVIFSQWTSFLNIIHMRLTQAGLDCTRVDGGMPKKMRDAAIERLSSDPNTRIMLASLAVCSVGLNLVAADTVILADSWWAPAIEDQAVDRVHRLGQSRPTTVWRLVTEDSIEERVLDIQAEKRKLVGVAFQEKVQRGKTRETRMADICRLLS